MDETDAPSVFRPTKRRRVFRKRAGSEDASYHDTTTTDAREASLEDPGDDAGDASDGVSVADILRRRQASKRSRAGIGFNNERDVQHGAQESNVQAQQSPAPDLTGGRFTRQTGMRVDDGTDKHM